MSKTKSALLIPLSLCFGQIWAQPSAGGAASGPVSRLAMEASVQPDAIRPKMRCGDLAGQVLPAADFGFPTRGATIISAVLVAAKPQTTDPAVNNPVLATPEYCKVTGAIKPVDALAPDIDFQLNIPTLWNGKVVQIGGGGLNGTIPRYLGATESGSPLAGAQPPDVPSPLSKGYALYGSDSGHQGDGTDWLANEEAWTNFSYAAIKKTRDAAARITQIMYGLVPRLTYYFGHSQGGREALEAAQRFPADYDGILSSSPLVEYSTHVISKTLYAIAQTGAGWIPPAKTKVIGDEVVRKCDALDGLSDRLIDNYRGCEALFASEPDPWAKIRCPQGKDTGMDCVSDAQIATLDLIHSPTKYGFPLAYGTTMVRGRSFGLEASASRAWINIDPQPRLDADPNLAAPGITLKYGILKAPNFNLLNFSPDAFVREIQAASKMIDTSNPDLAPFFAHGGKVIVKVHSPDTNSHPNATMQYYDAVVARSGQQTVDEHVRFYVMPNANHGGTGTSATTRKPVPQYVDLMKAIFDWVEEGVVPPDPLLQSAMLSTAPYSVTATKPLCRYPTYPRYRGSGDTELAASYTCSN